MSTSTHSIGRKLIRSGASGLASLVVASLAALVVMPYVIHNLGERNSGFWILTGTLLGYFGMLDLGLSRAVTRYVSQALGKENREEADRWINAGFFTYLFLSFLGVIASAIVWFVVGWFFSDPADAAVLQPAFFISTFAFSLGLPSLCFKGVIQAHVRQDVINCVQIAVSITRSAAVVLAVYLGGGLISLVVIAAVIYLLSSAAFVAEAYRVHGRIRFGLKIFSEADYGTFIRFAMASFLSQIADIMRFRTAPFIIGGLLGAAAVTPFAIAERLSTLAGGICQGVLTNLTPGFSTFEGAGGATGNEVLRRAYFFAYKISCLMGVYAVGMTLIFTKPFIVRWMGEEYEYVCPLAIILVVGVFFAVIQIPTICLLFSVSKQTFYAASNWLQAVGTVVLGIVLTYFFGLTGTVVAISAVSFIVKLFIQPLAATFVLDVSVVQYHLRHTLPNLGLPVVFMFVFYFAVRGFIVPNYAAMTAVGAAGTALFAPFAFFCCFNKAERSFLLKCVLPSRLRGKTA